MWVLKLDEHKVAGRQRCTNRQRYWNWMRDREMDKKNNRE
jgi:hypothetical protein